MEAGSTSSQGHYSTSFADFRTLHSEALDPNETACQGVNSRLSFVDANPEAELMAFNPLTTTISFFQGKDPEKWVPEVPTWAGVRYSGLYSGLNLELGGLGQTGAMRFICNEIGYREAQEKIQIQVIRAETAVLTGDSLNIGTAASEFCFPLLILNDNNDQQVDNMVLGG